ncbi:phage major capsid protein [Celeribacter ethanolicus]|uniref:Phage major capsid protein n=1 Tax=Celeribacter ethanolicus TaxID=1758178 RepID=A0A291GAP1_9RHOB|nr:phage major capsid protein [Celeribacter ethanolicus]ATG47603.1 phage major capsid protein [Celeribacter ethanolicus]
MKTLAELKKRLAELKAEGMKMVDAAESAGGTFTEDQETKFAAIESEIAQVEEDIKEREKLDERRRSMKGSTALTPAGQNTVNDLNPETTGGFKDIGEFAVAVHGAVRAGMRGGTIDDRLVAVDGVHTGGGDAGEGYALPPAYRDSVWELVNDFDEFGGLIDEEPTEKREVKLSADETTPWGTAGIKAYWRAEESQMTASQLSDEGRSVPLHELYTLAIATEELLEDAPRLNNRLGTKAAMAIAWKKNLAIVEGTGVGQPLGWMKSSAIITVAKESGQTADTVVAKNIVNMYARLQRIPGDKPFWLINQNCLPELMFMTIGDKPIWMPPNGLADAPGGFLLGLPVRFSPFAETLGDKGDIQLISPKGYYGVRRTSGVKFASSIHLYFDRGLQAFRWQFRYGGQPHLSKPVTPKNGATTLSHFVTLAERA